MPKYRYVASDVKGVKKRGVLDAPDENELYARLRADGLYIVSVEEQKRPLPRRPLTARQLGDFCRQLGTLQKAGVSLARALSIVSQAETITDRERASYTELLRSVRQGVALSDAMEQQPGVYPDLLVNMIRSGEASGNLDNVAMRMAVQYEKADRLNKKVKSATIYPRILAILIVLVLVFLMTFILPKFQGMFDRMGELPGSTAFLLWLSNALINHWSLFLIGAVVIVAACKILSHLPPIRYQLDRIKLHLPRIGKLLKTIYTARFARTLSSLYASGLPIVSALSIGSHTLGNAYIEKQFDEVVARVRSGQPLSQALRDVDGFVRKLADSAMIGEETGNLDSMLEATAESLEYDSEMALASLVAMLEPAMIIVLAAIIGFVMISVMLPIFQYYQSLETTSYM